MVGVWNDLPGPVWAVHNGVVLSRIKELVMVVKALRGLPVRRQIRPAARTRREARGAATTMSRSEADRKADERKEIRN